MDDDTKNKLKDVLSTIDPVEFKWDESNATVGVVAQTMSDSIYTSDGDMITIANNGYDSITVPGISSIDLNNLGNITIGASGSNGYNWSSNVGSFTIGTGISANTTEYGRNEIKLGNGKTIDLDDLHATIETVKKRLLILAPNFEMHEKYPMLKELYNEYIALEKLLSGPDNTPEDM